MQVRWGEGVLIGGWLVVWLAALWWAGVSDTAGLLIPILAAAAIPRIFRQLYPLSPRLRPVPPRRRVLGRAAVVLGLTLAVGGMFLPAPLLPVMSQHVADDAVTVFRQAWEAEHGLPSTAAEKEAARAALDRFTEEHVRQRVHMHDAETVQQDAARRLGMFGGAVLTTWGLVLGTGRPRRRRLKRTALALETQGRVQSRRRQGRLR